MSEEIVNFSVDMEAVKRKRTEILKQIFLLKSYWLGSTADCIATHEESVTF